MPSDAALPGFDPDLAHGEVLHVCGGQGSRDPNCCRSDETVGLVQCGSRCGKVAAPGSGEAAFGDAERGQPKAAKQSHRMGFLVGVEPTLCAHPCGRVVVPCVPRIGEGAEGRFNIVPTSFVVEGLAHRCFDVRPSLASPSATVELFDKFVVQKLCADACVNLDPPVFDNSPGL